MPSPSSRHCHSLLASAALLPSYLTSPNPIISFTPVVLPVSNRRVPWESASHSLRSNPPTPRQAQPAFPSLSSPTATAAAVGSSPHNGYAPLVSFSASLGFCVLQLTHSSSKSLELLERQTRRAKSRILAWQSHVEDLSHILGALGMIESAVPGGLLQGRLNKPEPRIKSGVILVGLRNATGGRDISETVKTAYIPCYGGESAKTERQALVVYGDENVGPHLTTRGPDLYGDSYLCAPGKRDQLVLKEARHGLGGVSGWDAAETKDESPELLGTVQRTTWAYLMSALSEGDETWSEACKVFKELARGVVDDKE